MIKIKSLSLIALASSALFFSGCVPQNTLVTASTGNYYNGYNEPSVHVSLGTYAYPYYYDRPYYFLNGLYYYGGFFRDGYYYYGKHRLRHGHYYHHGYRYHNGRRYKARNGRYGYYSNRKSYQRIHKGRAYHRDRKEHYLGKIRKSNHNVHIKSDRYRAREMRHHYNRQNNHATIQNIVRNHSGSRPNYIRSRDR